MPQRRSRKLSAPLSSSFPFPLEGGGQGSSHRACAMPSPGGGVVFKQSYSPLGSLRSPASPFRGEAKNMGYRKHIFHHRDRRLAHRRREYSRPRRQLSVENHHHHRARFARWRYRSV